MIVVDYWDLLLLPLGNERGEIKQIPMLNIARTWRVAPERYLELAQHLNQLEQGLCVLDKDGHVRHWNRAFIDMFKLDLSQLTNGMAFSAMEGAAGFPIQLPLRRHVATRFVGSQGKGNCQGQTVASSNSGHRMAGYSN